MLLITGHIILLITGHLFRNIVESMLIKVREERLRKVAGAVHQSLMISEVITVNYSVRFIDETAINKIWSICKPLHVLANHQNLIAQTNLGLTNSIEMIKCKQKI
ncbi:hypothetical protein BpHYR1_022434 [Brachionus plicatilis]|uniref:Uncharacterized protein n=1 Tax=Brachionus plicatilis TaxID=10195 RepID=A0A3M7REU3_BRAPC|nr:hypothetical protein BpHYR1_022434 [Brachionus plicatilis]